MKKLWLIYLACEHLYLKMRHWASFLVRVTVQFVLLCHPSPGGLSSACTEAREVVSMAKVVLSPRHVACSKLVLPLGPLLTNPMRLGTRSCMPILLAVATRRIACYSLFGS